MRSARPTAWVAALALLACALAPAPAGAQQVYNPLGGELRLIPEDFSSPPRGYRLTALQAIRAAVGTAPAREVLRANPRLRIRPYIRAGQREWFVLFVQKPKILLEVDVDDRTGSVIREWRGFQADWYLTRGDEGVVGLKLNAPYVWLPLCALFMLPFLDRRRPFRILHFDLLALLAFGASHYFMNQGRVDISVWLVYPVLAYLAFRLASLAWRPARGRGPLLARGSLGWLVAGIVLLVAVRLVLTLHYAADNVMDVGYASVIGADRIVDGEELYVFNEATGDTYGPAAYLAYVPFEQIFPWTGGVDALRPAKAAAIAFDLLTMAGLFVLGRRLRAGRSGLLLGAALAYAWAAYPYTAYALVAGTNDALIAALLVWALVFLARPVAAGAFTGLAAAAKFAPLAVVPVIARGAGGTVRRRALAVGAALGAIALVTVPLLPDGGVREFYDTTLGFQVSRYSPFSPWGQDASLRPLQVALEAVALAVVAATMLAGRIRGTASVAAAGALALVAIQSPATHWFFFYIVWFAPWALVAFLAPYVTKDSKKVAGRW